MDTITYVVLDTNILFRVATQGEPGCELMSWERLKKHVTDGTVRLLVPETVLLEFEKLRRKAESSLDVAVSKFEATAALKEKAKAAWNEISDLGDDVIAYLKNWKQEKLVSLEQRCDNIVGYLTSGEVIHVSLTPEILLRAFKRRLSGRIGNLDKENRDADCSIVECLVEFFRDKVNKEKHQLLICTENIKDFGYAVNDTMAAVLPLVQEGLPPAELFKNLVDMLKFIDDRHEVKTPAPEVAKKALSEEVANNVAEQIGNYLEALNEAGWEAVQPSEGPWFTYAHDKIPWVAMPKIRSVTSGERNLLLQIEQLNQQVQDLKARLEAATQSPKSPSEPPATPNA
jgi:rRNA-processing protein FCF1